MSEARCQAERLVKVLELYAHSLYIFGYCATIIIYCLCYYLAFFMHLMGAVGLNCFLFFFATSKVESIQVFEINCNIPHIECFLRIYNVYVNTSCLVFWHFITCM